MSWLFNYILDDYVNVHDNANVNTHASAYNTRFHGKDTFDFRIQRTPLMDLSIIKLSSITLSDIFGLQWSKIWVFMLPGIHERCQRVVVVVIMVATSGITNKDGDPLICSSLLNLIHLLNVIKKISLELMFGGSIA